jgi:hypothetical protein
MEHRSGSEALDESVNSPRIRQVALLDIPRIYSIKAPVRPTADHRDHIVPVVNEKAV